ncbi:MAG: hypothetical protein K6D02_08910 [Lachnospiraceae bacterium]|nr:hypothetical protein [Lachnospiraceae bacterium]
MRFFRRTKDSEKMINRENVRSGKSMFGKLNKKMGKKIFTMILAFSVLITSPTGTKIVNAAEEPTQYIKEIKLSYGKTEEAAAQWLINHGYKVVKGDINVGTDVAGGGDTNAVVIGYKTTTDKYEAVRDMALMNMTGGYKMTDMETILESQQKQVDDNMERVIALAEEYKANYEDAKKSDGEESCVAIRVHNLLNNYTEDDSDEGMGDIFLKDYSEDTEKGKKNRATLRNILIQANQELLVAIENLLSLSGGEVGDSWLVKQSRLNSKATYFTRIKSIKKTNNLTKNYIEKLYGEYIDAALEKWDDFYEKLEECDTIMGEISEKTGGKEITQKDVFDYFGIDEDAMDDSEEIIDDSDVPSSSAIDEDTDEESEEATGEAVNTDNKLLSKSEYNEVIEQMDAVNENLEQSEAVAKAQQFLETMSVITYLATLQYGSEKSSVLELFFHKADYFKEDNNKYELGSMFEAMTETQRESILNDLSIYDAIRNAIAGDDEQTWKGEDEKQVKSLDKTIDEMAKTSIYTGVKRDMYKEGVAITYSAQRNTESVFNDSDKSFWIVGGIIAGTAVASMIGTLFISIGIKRASFFLDYTNFKFLKHITKYYEVDDAYWLTGFCPKLSEKMQELGSRLFYFRGTEKYIAQWIEDFNFAEPLERPGIIRRLKAYYIITNSFTVILGIAIIAVTVYFSVKEIWNIINDRKSAYTGDYSEAIPRFMVDSSLDTDGEESYVYYEAVTCNRNDKDMNGVKKTDAGLKDFGDINGDTGKQWVALYESTDVNAGSPIIAGSLEVKYGNVQADEEHKQLHTFNEPNVGANLTSMTYCFNDKKDGTYLRYKVDTKADKGSSGTDLLNTALKDAKNNQNKDAGAAFLNVNKTVAAATFILGGGLIGFLLCFVLERKKETINSDDED